MEGGRLDHLRAHPVHSARRGVARSIRWDSRQPPDRDRARGDARRDIAYEGPPTLARYSLWSKPMSSSSPRDSHGQVLALFALFLIVLIGATAVTVDYGTWLKVRRDYQNFSDAAALAGGGFLSRPISSSQSDPKRIQARRAAWDSLNAQLGLGLNNGQLNNLDDTNTPAGSPESIAGYRLWVSTPPIDATTKYPGAFTGSNDRDLFVWVERDNPSFFSHVFGLGDKTVQAWATAGAFAS